MLKILSGISVLLLCCQSAIVDAAETAPLRKIVTSRSIRQLRPMALASKNFRPPVRNFSMLRKRLPHELKVVINRPDTNNFTAPIALPQETEIIPCLKVGASWKDIVAVNGKYSVKTISSIDKQLGDSAKQLHILATNFDSGNFLQIAKYSRSLSDEVVDVACSWQREQDKLPADKKPVTKGLHEETILNNDNAARLQLLSDELKLKIQRLNEEIALNNINAARLKALHEIE